MIQPHWQRSGLHTARSTSARQALQHITNPTAASDPSSSTHSLTPPTAQARLLRRLIQALVFDRCVTARIGVHALIAVLLVLLIIGEARPQPLLTGIALTPPPTLATPRMASGGIGTLQAADEAVVLVGSFITPATEQSYTPPAALTDTELDNVAPTVREVVAVATPVFTTIHTLQTGETLGGIAEQYNVSLDTLVWSNPAINGEVLIRGQELRIARMTGIPYTIQAGDTLDSIAARFGVNADMIAAFKPNGISVGQPLPAGREIFIVDGTAAIPEKLLSAYGGIAGLAATGPQNAGITRSASSLLEGPDTVYAAKAKVDGGRRVKLIGQHDGWAKISVGDTTGWLPLSALDVASDILAQVPTTNDFPAPPPMWVWPARGAFTSGYGWRWGGFHNGIDIAAGAWSPIVAARAGTVIEAGWCSGYGFCVRMSHGDGIQTLYAHMIDYPTVSVGQQVPVGSVIGHMGSSYDLAGGGYSTGVHLHFEVRVNGVNVDPLIYLP